MSSNMAAPERNDTIIQYYTYQQLQSVMCPKMSSVLFLLLHTSRTPDTPHLVLESMSLTSGLEWAWNYLDQEYTSRAVQGRDEQRIWLLLSF